VSKGYLSRAHDKKRDSDLFRQLRSSSDGRIGTLICLVRIRYAVANLPWWIWFLFSIHTTSSARISMSLVHCIAALTGQHHSVHAIPSYPRFPSRSDGTQLVSSLGVIPSPRRRRTWTRSHVYGSKTSSILKHDSIQHRNIHLATGRSRCAPKSYMHQPFANGLHLPDPLERSEPPRLQSRYAKLSRLGC
jgi:hypothetical protein